MTRKRKRPSAFPEVAPDGRVRIGRSARMLLGLGLALLGLASGAGPWLLLRSARQRHTDALRQASWVAGECVITSATPVRLGAGEDHEDGLEVTFEHTVEGKTYDGLQYRYDTLIGAAQYAKGRRVPCFYEPKDPAQATLVLATPPKGPPPAAGFGEVLFTLFGVGLFPLGVWMIFTRRQLYTRPSDD
jgi:hypothetical protein